MRMASILGLFLSIVVLLFLVVQLDADRATLAGVVPDGHSALSNLLPVLLLGAAGPLLAVAAVLVAVYLWRGRG